MTMTLVLAGGGVILAAAPTVTDLGDRYDAGDGQYPKTVATGGLQEVPSLPDGFDARYCTYDGEAVVCDFPEPPPRSQEEIDAANAPLVAEQVEDRYERLAREAARQGEELAALKYKLIASGLIPSGGV